MHGRVLETDGRPVPDTLVEVWQCNAAGRYRHQGDQHPAPLDPNFTGLGRCLTDADGRSASSRSSPARIRGATTTTPGAPRTSTSRVFGRAFAQRLVTQMYFPGDPLFAQDPIFNSARRGRASGSSRAFDLDRTEPEWALAYRWDIVLRAGPRSRMPDAHARPRPSGRSSRSGCRGPTGRPSSSRAPTGAIALRGGVHDGEGAPVPDALIETWQADPGRRPRRGFGALPDRRARAAGRSSRASPARRRRRGAAHRRRRVRARPAATASSTRIYFGDEPEANAADPLLAGLDADRARDAGRRSPTDGGYRFDIHLQGRP